MKIKKRKAESENHERWVVSYADFVTLLFAFFVILYATSEQNTEKGKKFEDSVNKYLVKVGMMSSGKESVQTQVSQDSPIAAPLKKYKRNNSAAKGLQNKIETYFEDVFNENELEKILQDISGEEVGVKISFKSQSLFKKNSYEFVPASKKSLNKLGELFNKIKYRVFVEGHTGPVPDSWSLSAMRAVKLVELFTKKYGIDKQRIAAVSYGASRPIFPISSEQSEGNNRIDFLILTEDINYQ